MARPLPRSLFRRFNSSPEVIRLVVMMYVRYPAVAAQRPHSSYSKNKAVGSASEYTQEIVHKNRINLVSDSKMSDIALCWRLAISSSATSSAPDSFVSSQGDQTN